MLGRLIQSLDNPAVADALLATLEDPALHARLSAAAEASGRAPADIVTSIVRGFVDTASDDHWTQLIGIMNRADDPALAALRAILAKGLAATEAS
jgi:hypothetical protein